MDRQRIAKRVAAGFAGIAAGSLIASYGARRLKSEPQRAADRMRATYPALDTPKPVVDDVWIVDSGPMHVLGLTLPIRMTVVRLAGGDLLLHSPVAWSASLASEVAALGRVRHLVAPNTAHWTFLAGWQHAFPDAITWGAPGLRDRGQVRRSDVRIDRDLGPQAPPEWGEDIVQGIVAGGAGFREVYLFHTPSKTLLLTDLVQNVEPPKLPPISRAVMALARATDGRAALYLRAVVKQGGAAASASAQDMVALAPDRVIFAHGRWFADDATARLRRALDWLL